VSDSNPKRVAERVTSGTYEPGYHLVRPFTGDATAATVLVTGPELADALAVFCREGLEFRKVVNDYELVVVDEWNREYARERSPTAENFVDLEAR
jgi:hypothetical protein